MLSVITALLLAPKPPRELYEYLTKPDKSFSYKVVSRSAGRTDISLTSQTWHGVTWTHKLLLQQPETVKYPHCGILYITGDGPFPGDYTMLALVTAATGMPCAMLFDVPNQPIDGLREDDLIAKTFIDYLKKPDPTLPLLFPMAKSAIRAMDAVQGLTKGTNNEIDSFIVAGASKRGWTTWFVGASDDPRVKAIAPMVIDTLNIPAQMKHQIDTWGQYSEMIKAYTQMGLQKQLETPKGHDLGEIIDPFSYRRNIRVPTLIVKGSNDPYWTADALDQYWTGLHQPKWILTVPNTGHTLGDGIMAVATIGAFAQSIAGAFPMPKLSWKYPQEPGKAVIEVTSENPPMTKFTMWAAESDDLDFRKSKYEAVAASDPSLEKDKSGKRPVFATGFARVEYALPPNKNVAVFGELRYFVDGKVFSLSTPTEIYRKSDQ